MPYSGTKSLVSSRIFEAKALRRLCGDEGTDPDEARSVRGLIYITLYGMYEAVVSKCVSTAIDLANNYALQHRELKEGVQLFALKHDLQSYRAVSVEKSWVKGLELLRKIQSMDGAKLTQVFPADGTFMRPTQLRLIWSLFEIPGEPWPEQRFQGRIHELVEARNDVAHGSESAGQRGGRLSDEEMDARISDAEAICVHIISAFSNHVNAATAFQR